MSLHTVQGINSGRANGDYVSDSAINALNGVYHYWVEVPPGVPNLTVDLYDADLGINTPGNEDDLNRDRDRGGFDSTCAYSAFRPNNTAITTSFTTGTNALPAGSDGNWLTFFTVGGTTVLDQFGAVAYGNNNGTQNWAGNWIETNDDANPNAGNIRITGGELRIRDDTNVNAASSTIEREANLSTWSIATLTFTMRTENVDVGDVMLLQVSSNGGGAWTTIATYSGAFAAAVTQSYNISAFRAANTRVRFIQSANYSGNDSFFVDNVQIQDQITAGHYEVRVDMGVEDDVNAFGIRATSTDGTELNVYVDDIVPFGTNPNNGNTTTRTYQFYPYITSGCSCLHSDFDSDSSRTTLSHITYRNPSNVLIADFLDASLSDENAWGHQEVTGWTTDQASTGYGMWDFDATIQSYGANGNYTDIVVGDYVRAAAFAAAGTANPTANPEANAFRIYLPTDDATAPVKPVLEQLLAQRFVGNLPAGVQRRYTVTVRIDNRTAYPITFSNALGNVVTAHVPGTKVLYGGNFQKTQGTMISQPAVGAAGDVVWDPGSVTTTTTLTAASMSYDILVTVASGDHIPVTGTAGSDGTRAKFIDETGNATQTRATYTLGQVCELMVEQGLATPVLLSSFDAGIRAGVTNLEWVTAAELGTIGFNVYRVDPSRNGALIRINDRTIAAGPGAPQGARYRLVDRGNLAASGTYYLEELTADGKKNRYGPYFASAKRIVQPPANGQLSDRQPRGNFNTVEIIDIGDPPHLSNAEAVMVGVGRTGIVRVTGADIAANLNVPLSTVLGAIAGNGLVVSNNGVAVSWSGNAAHDAVLFYGEQGDTIFSNERVYRIALGSGTPMDIVQVTGGSAPLTTFAGTKELETDAFAATVLPLDPESDYWFWDYVLSGDPADGRKTFSVNIPAVASTSGATLQVRLQGALAGTAHRARVWLNNSPIGELTWDGVDGKTADLPIPVALLLDGNNDLAVEGVLEPGLSFDVFYVDGFRVAYQKKAVPEAATLFLMAPAGGQVTAGPFATLPCVLDVTDKTHPRMLQNGSFAGGNLSFATPPGVQSVFFSERAGFVAPAYVRGSAPPSLVENLSGADYIVITPRALHDGAQALASFRASDGLQTLVVDLDQIYDELNGGNPNPGAIRTFLGITSRWQRKPKYVVLIGTGTVDYRGIQTSPGPMPPMMFRTADGLYASDSLYADRNFDNVPDLAIGRIPITTAAELSAYLQKLSDAAQVQTASSKIIWSADLVDQGANFRQASRKAESPLADRPASRIYLDQLGSDGARTAMFSAWQSGATLMNWVGHGGLDRLSTTSLLTVDDVPSLTTTGPLPIVTAMTCSINRFDIGVVDSLGAALTRAPNAGALAVWSSSGMSIHSDAAGLGRTFVRLAAQMPDARLGDLILKALTTTPNLGETGPLYLLLGDPALRLALPAPPDPPAATGPVTE
ncbi:MAG TPA: C25 family cysteine peptidase [Thermoanaerobaculia bacterium]|nr:C25 family cysteine peptidase [Thermoanaerobaculia bacterium]